MLYEHNDALRSAIRRARIVKVDDSGTQQLVDLAGLKKEKPQKIYRPMDFGFGSYPPDDTEGVMIQMGSRSDRTLYFDGGHKDYRPKDRPKGSVCLFDQYGDLIQSDKDKTQIVHAKKIDIHLGKGYDAKDAKNYDGPVVSIVATKDSLKVTFDDTSIEMKKGKITQKVGTSTIVIENSKITETVGSSVITIEGGKIKLKSGAIVLDGMVKLGSENANRPASAQGTIDSRGDSDTGNFANKVLVE